MAKAYWIVRVDVSDPGAYKAYAEANGPAFKKYGARFLVRGGAYDSLEGKARGRNVVIEFKDIATARACYHSEEYQQAMALRRYAAEADLIIIDGYDGAQP